MTPEYLTVHKSTDNDLVTVAGELDAGSCPPVRDAVLSMLTRCSRPAAPETGWSRTCVLDLSGVTFAASAGLSLLLELATRARADAVELVTVVPSDSALGRLLRRTGLDTQLPLRESLADLDEEGGS